MLSVSQLAQRCGLGRGRLLYYESIGLLKPASRAAANYRSYGEGHLRRLQHICVYPNAGLKLDDIRSILARPDNDASVVLQRRLIELSREIEELREHQEFLEFLHIPKEEIRSIRDWSRNPKR